MGGDIVRLTIADLDIANSIMRHPDVFPFIRDDYSPDVEDFTARTLLEMPMVYFLLPSPGCLFILVPFVTSTMYEGHTAVVPESRGKQAIQAGKDAIRWMFENTRCERIVGFFPESNRRALLGAIHMGMKRTHRIPSAMHFQGIRNDLIMVEVGKHKEQMED